MCVEGVAGAEVLEVERQALSARDSKQLRAIETGLLDTDTVLLGDALVVRNAGVALRSARSRRRLPTKHHGHAISDHTSMLSSGITTT